MVKTVQIKRTEKNGPILDRLEKLAQLWGLTVPQMATAALNAGILRLGESELLNGVEMTGGTDADSKA